METKRIRSGDVEISYTVLGSGPDVVLLHPFPAHHGIWLPVAEQLAARYRCVLPDLRGHGASEPGEGPATMEKHASDVRRVCDDAGLGRAVFVGVSIGGYVLFEFWRRFRERVSALVLCETRAPADSDETRRARLASIDQVQKHGPDGFLDAQAERLLGTTTRRNRPDIVEPARAMMGRITIAGIAAVQQGMASRPDSVPTLKTINVPTLVMVGDEDAVTPRADAELMQKGIAGAQLEVIRAAGHYSPFEQPEQVARLMRQFLDSSRR
jgi:pimeloyl-ACP methyl ester carboxylesterase